MGPHQVKLKLTDLFSGNADVAQLADTGSDRIRNLVLCDEFVHDSAGPIDHFAGIGIKENSTALGRHFEHGFESQVVSVDVQRFQGSSQFSPVTCRAGSLTRPSAGQRPAPTQSYLCSASRKTFMYFSGNALAFICLSATMCVVSPSACSSPVCAFSSSYPK